LCRKQKTPIFPACAFGRVEQGNGQALKTLVTFSRRALVMLVTLQAHFIIGDILQISFLLFSRKSRKTGKKILYLKVTQAQGAKRFIYAFNPFTNAGLTII
jgi:hypothetical protein